MRAGLWSCTFLAASVQEIADLLDVSLGPWSENGVAPGLGFRKA
jgi:hypothetical protein